MDLKCSVGRKTCTWVLYATGLGPPCLLGASVQNNGSPGEPALRSTPARAPSVVTPAGTDTICCLKLKPRENQRCCEYTQPVPFEPGGTGTCAKKRMQNTQKLPTCTSTQVLYLLPVPASYPPFTLLGYGKPGRLGRRLRSLTEAALEGCLCHHLGSSRYLQPCTKAGQPAAVVGLLLVTRPCRSCLAVPSPVLVHGMQTCPHSDTTPTGAPAPAHSGFQRQAQKGCAPSGTGWRQWRREPCAAPAPAVCVHSSWGGGGGAAPTAASAEQSACLGIDCLADLHSMQGGSDSWRPPELPARPVRCGHATPSAMDGTAVLPSALYTNRLAARRSG